jgi:menaquinone-9 beta-reductase
MSPTYDVVIAGAGPGGSAAAYYLARQGLDVLLLDKFDFPRDKTCGDAMTPRALAILRDMGILNKLHETGCRASGLEIYGPRGHSTVAAIPNYPECPAYILVAPRLTLDDVIREKALAAGARFEGRFRVNNIEPDGRGVSVEGRQQGKRRSIRARMAIVATGASVGLLLRMGLLAQAPRMSVAARSYFEGVSGLDENIQFRFDGVPLPGYGWVFPLSASSANVGAGFFRVGRRAGRMPATAAAAFEGFVQSSPLRAMLAKARQVGPIKGYPLRVDFATAPTYGNRVLLVGEAAGLVNPLTGEGIDYALESGQVAAQHLGRMFVEADFSWQALASYDDLLRQRFQQLFVFCNRIRDLLLNRFLLDRLIKMASQQPDLKTLLIDVVLGHYSISDRITPRTLLRTLLAAASPRMR